MTAVILLTKSKFSEKQSCKLDMPILYAYKQACTWWLKLPRRTRRPPLVTAQLLPEHSRRLRLDFRLPLKQEATKVLQKLVLCLRVYV